MLETIVIGSLCAMLANFLTKKFQRFASNPESLETEIADVDESDLPKCLAESRAIRSDRLRQLGYTKCGNLCCKRRGTVAYSCFYLSADSRTLLIDCVYKGFFGRFPSKYVTALRSVGADGHLIETCSHKKLPSVFDDMSRESMMTITAVATDDVHSLISKHQAAVDEELATFKNTLAEITPESIGELEDYSMNLVDWQMHRTGYLKMPMDKIVLRGNRFSVPIRH